MRIMYVDESGDPGNGQYASPHYILTGLIIEEKDWKLCLDGLIALRKAIYLRYGLRQRTEFHSSEIFRTSLDTYKSIMKRSRVEMLKFYVEQIPIIFSNAKSINICINKSVNPLVTNFQTFAWSRLISRYDTHLKKSAKDYGIIICDESNENILRNQLRKSRIYNPTPSMFGGTYNPVVQNIIEDIIHRNSSISYFIQTADVICHVLYRREFIKGSLRKYGIEKVFNLLEPILLKEASNSDLLGIVRS